MKRLILSVVMSLCGIQAATAAPSSITQSGQPLSQADEKPDWALQVTPFLWVASLSGKVAPFQRGGTIDVDKSFSEVMSDLNMGGFINIWGRYDRFVFSGNMMYVDTSDSRKNGPLPAIQVPGLAATIPPGSSVNGKADTTQFMATLQGGYRFIDEPEFTFDALAGLRFWHISNDLTVTASHPLIGSKTYTYSEDFSWVDPLVGFRLFVPLMENLSFQSEADIGGFGIASDITWSILASANYTFTDNLSASVGYKALKVDYDHNGYVYDALLSGPVIGVTWRF